MEKIEIFWYLIIGCIFATVYFHPKYIKALTFILLYLVTIK